MISSRLNHLRDKVNIRTQRERFFFLLVGWAIIYLFWSILIMRPLIKQQTIVSNEIISVQNQIDTARKKADTIVTMAMDTSLNKKLSDEQQLVAQSILLKNRIDLLTASVIPHEQIPQIMKDVFQPFNGIILVNIRNISTEPLVPPGILMEDLAVKIGSLYKHTFEVEFQGDYFKTIEFLKHLETLPWHLYADNLEYKVLAYPQGDVIVNFHILVK